jgi:hypothetical protein
MVAAALRTRFCSSSASTRSEFQISPRSLTDMSGKAAQSSLIFVTPSLSEALLRNTAACCCMVRCIASRNVLTLMPPCAWRVQSNRSRLASPAFGGKFGWLAPG